MGQPTTKYPIIRSAPIALALALGLWAALARAERPAAEGPPRARRSALVVPSRVLSSEKDERLTIDLLVAAALGELGLTPIDAGDVCRALDASVPDLEEARSLQLALKLEAAFETAARAREGHLAHGGDLLADKELTEAELVMVRILVDLGRRAEAASLADAVLVREPERRLDPVYDPPPMQALWIEAVERRASYRPTEHDVAELAAAARRANADYAVAAVEKRAANGTSWLVLQVVPATSGEGAFRQPVRLGARSGWSEDIRSALTQRFGRKVSESERLVAKGPSSPAPVPAITDAGEKKPWYKRWWFWTAVGIVVVGGVAVGVGAWASSKSHNDVVFDPTLEGAYARGE